MKTGRGTCFCVFLIYIFSLMKELFGKKRLGNDNRLVAGLKKNQDVSLYSTIFFSHQTGGV